MNFYDKELEQIIVSLNSNKNIGLNQTAQLKNAQKGWQTQIGVI